MHAGAIIFGKAKLQAMIMREELLECVEFSAPFNPRGDRYLVPSGSSHGVVRALVHMTGTISQLDLTVRILQEFD